MNTKTKKEAAIASMQRLRLEGELAKAKFVRALDENTMHALEWSHEMFRASATASAAFFMLRMLNDSPLGDDKVVASAAKFAEETAMRMTRYAATFSTSPPSNFLNACSAQAYAQVAELLAELVQS